VRIAVLIPTWQRADPLERCLRGLELQQRCPEEVIVAAREEDESTMALLAATASSSFQLRAVTVSEEGVVAALNAGLASATCDVIAITDDDTVPRADWLARIEEHFVADAGLGGVGGRDWVHDGATEFEAGRSTVGRLRWYGRLIGNHHLGVGGPREVEILKGANMSFRRPALRETRLDSKLRGSGAQVHWEVGLCLAVRSAGWRLAYDPAVAVDHYSAERVGETRGLRGTALADAVHNETYLLLKWLPWWQKPAALLYWLGIGSRTAPGILLLIERCVREENRDTVLQRFRTALVGRISGVRTFLRSGFFRKGQ
jgi:GT2 family glycosyltransferase